MAATIIGLDRLLARLENIAGNEAIMAGIQKGSLRVEASAKELCTVDTGYLRESIRHDLHAGSLSGTIGTNVEYAPYVEFGSSGKSPQAFLYPALASNVDKIKQDILQAIRSEIRRG